MPLHRVLRRVSASSSTYPVIPHQHRLVPRTRYLAHANPTGLRGIPPPLEGIRVLDLTRVLAGPTATMLLADLGADVIKIEEVKRGDDTRSWLPPFAPISDDAPEGTEHLPPESAYFLSVNRNKRSCTVNFKRPEGLQILYDLIKKADILVENFIPGKLSEIGLGWEDCVKLNERLIYASITGVSV
jgi:succinate--hydroxymethylglutarate CoA-transferase